jgi:SNF2 family DNA or RNA helicase
MVRPNFLHGKLYHITETGRKQHAIAGSSNFTVSGLGLSKTSNVELNLIVDSDRDREDLVDWFGQFWNPEGQYANLVEDVKDEVLKYLEQLYTENTPRFVYYKTLYHLFEDYLNQQRDDDGIDPKTGFFDSVVWNTLYDFQKDGVRSAINKIKQHNGCIIADSVGLGKTYEALAVIKYYESQNTRVLVLCPKKLRENWTIWKANDDRNNLVDDRFSYDVISHTDLGRDGGRSGDLDLANLKWANYGLIVIDESHNFRSSKPGKKDENGERRRSRYEILMEDIIRTGVQTRVLLLSATPVNNNLRDLRNQIYLITGNVDSAFLDIGVRSLTSTMRLAQLEFTKGMPGEQEPDRPVVLDRSSGYLEQAEAYQKGGDYAAAAMNMRKACEEKLRELLPFNRLYKLKDEGNIIKKNSLHGFIEKMEVYRNQRGIDTDLFLRLMRLKDRVLNPFSHDHQGSPYYRREIEEAIEIVKELDAVEVRTVILASEGKLKPLVWEYDDRSFPIIPVENLRLYRFREQPPLLSACKCKLLDGTMADSLESAMRSLFGKDMKRGQLGNDVADHFGALRLFDGTSLQDQLTRP